MDYVIELRIINSFVRIASRTRIPIGEMAQMTRDTGVRVRRRRAPRTRARASPWVRPHATEKASGADGTTGSRNNRVGCGGDFFRRLRGNDGGDGTLAAHEHRGLVRYGRECTRRR